jgi:uncharacterized peroxidase-related enzyme
MPLVQLLERDETAPEVAEIFSLVTAEYGFVPNILRALAHCPELLQAFVPLWAQVYRSPVIGPRLRALAALGTAKAQDCAYCVAHMSASARRAGVGSEEISAIGDALRERDTFSEREALILELAGRVTNDPDGTSEEIRQRLRSGFSEPEIVNIVLVIGMYNLTSRFLKAIDIEIEDIYRAAPEPGTSPLADRNS